MNTKNLMELNSPTMANANSIEEFQRVYLNNIIGEKLKNNCANQIKHTYINCKFDNINEIHTTLEENFHFYKVNNKDGYILEEEYIADIVWEYESSNVGFSITVLANSLKACDTYIYKIKTVLSKFVIHAPLISYKMVQYISKEQTSTLRYKDSIKIDFIPEAVPFIDDVDKYINNFLDSKAPILILQGSPGTGKTTFTKYILSIMQQKLNDLRSLEVMYSFDEDIFTSTQFFVNMLGLDYDILVLEDFNFSIHKNQDSEGTNPLNKFLSITDGLLSKYKKIIITTNIESKNQLLPALIRPGRCFDILNFRNLEGVEIDNLCDSYATNLNLQTESISLSEFYAKCNDEQNSSIQKTKVGF